MLTYKKDGGENYPVKPGQVWHVGGHQIRCGDLTNADDVAWISQFKPVLVYTDPPWGQALASGFRTKADLADYVDVWDLYRAAFQIVHDAFDNPPTYFEQGNKWRQQMQEIAVDVGLELEEDWNITYYKKSPASLTLFNSYGKPYTNLNGFDDDQTPVMAIADFTKRGDLVVDLMTGRGLTATSAANADRMFAGLELSPWRTSVTLTKLAKITMEIPQIGN